MGNLINTLELKLRPFEVTPYVCIGSHAFAMFSAHALHEGRATHEHQRAGSALSSDGDGRASALLFSSNYSCEPNSNASALLACARWMSVVPAAEIICH